MTATPSLLKVYVAGKVSKSSHFAGPDWRSAFVEELAQKSGRQLASLDPIKSGLNPANLTEVFGGDAYMISMADVLVVYLSDDISIGGSQEILIAKYFKKPVIGLAPLGGKFNGSTKEYFGEVVENYQDPFVFSTCDIVCATVDEVAKALKTVESIEPKDITLIDEQLKAFQDKHLDSNDYLKTLI